MGHFPFYIYITIKRDHYMQITDMNKISYKPVSFGKQSVNFAKFDSVPDKFEKTKNDDEEKEKKPNLFQRIKHKLSSMTSQEWVNVALITSAVVSVGYLVGQSDGWKNFSNGTKNKIKNMKLPGGKEFGETKFGQWLFKNTVNSGKLEKYNPNASGIKMDDLVGDHMTEAKNEMLDRIRYFADPESAKKYGIKKMDGILLSGPPGNGKTELVKAMCNEHNLTMYSTNCADLGSTYQKESQTFAKNAFEEVYQLGEQAKKTGKPVVFFLDECDAIFKNRNNSHLAEDSKDTVNVLLPLIQEASDHNVLLIGASNIIDGIDAAVQRPGRFKNIVLENPKINDAAKIFACKFNKVPKEVISQNLLQSGRIERIFMDEVNKSGISREQLNSALSGAKLTDMIESTKKSAWVEQGTIDESKIRIYIKDVLGKVEKELKEAKPALPFAF